MTILLRFFSEYAVLIYLALALGSLFAIRALARARQELNQSVFGLERELAQRHIAQSLTALILVILLAGSEVVLTAFLIPSLPAFSLLPTPTFNPLATQTSTLPVELLQTIGALTPEPSSTAQASGCVPGQIMITYPKPGDIIRGSIDLLGTATIPNFGYFYFEFSPAGSDSWQTIAGGNTTRQDTGLGSWDTSLITPGYYQLRLVVTDSQANILPACVVPVQIAAP